MFKFYAVRDDGIICCIVPEANDCSDARNKASKLLAAQPTLEAWVKQGKRMMYVSEYNEYCDARDKAANLMNTASTANMPRLSLC